MSAVTWKNTHDRGSHANFFNERDWKSIELFWSNLIRTRRFPTIIKGDEDYGLTNLDQYSFEKNCRSKKIDPKEKRKSFAFVIGYDGNRYSGYQQQKGTEMITVEDDLDIAFKRKLIASGRTDKSVSAISQVISFSTYDDITLEAVLEQVKASEPFQSHRLTLLDAARVPRKFHPIFCATWRRYVYLFPLKTGQYGSECIDVDCTFVNDCLSKIVKKTLPFNGFAHRDDRANGEGLQDYCFLYRLRAEVIDIQTEQSQDCSSPKALCIELVGSRFLRRMVRILSATVIRESLLPEIERDVDILYKICVSRDRSHSALALPGVGLALCGVGFQLHGSALEVPPIDNHDQEIINSFLSTLTKRITNEDEEENSDENDCEHRKRKSSSQSRRERYQTNKKDRKSCAFISTGSVETPQSNTADINRFLASLPPQSYECIREISFQEELVNCNPELLYYPERFFHFIGGDILLSQSYTQVDSTIWDAEVILAHFVERLWKENLFVASEGVTRPNLLEMGAGTALASLVAYQTSKFESIGIQDMPEVISRVGPLLQEKINEIHPRDNAHVSEVIPIGCLWGGDAIITIQNEIKCSALDWIIMADVLYHTEDFIALTQTIRGILKKNGQLVIAFEQRRKDLNEFLCQLLTWFTTCQVYHYVIEPSSSDSDHILSSRNVFVCWFQNHK